MEKTKYMPLAIPRGWAITYNNIFGDVEPIIVNGKIENWEFFKEDLLHINSLRLGEGGWKIDKEGYFVDVGWYPDGDPNGNYKFYLLKGSWENEIFYLKSKNRYEIQQAIEITLDLIKNHSIKEKILKTVIKLAIRSFEKKKAEENL